MYQTMWAEDHAAVAVFFVVTFILLQFWLLGLVLSVFVDAFETRQWECDERSQQRLVTALSQQEGRGKRYYVQGGLSRRLTTLSAYISGALRRAREVLEPDSAPTGRGSGDKDDGGGSGSSSCAPGCLRTDRFGRRSASSAASSSARAAAHAMAPFADHRDI